MLPAGVLGDRLTTPARNPYWFPDKQIGVGDLVVIYTKEGGDNDSLMEVSTGGRGADAKYNGS